MQRATLIGILALAVAAILALPGSALASGNGHHGTHANRGNHCGHGHVKHTRGVGHSCQKLSRHPNAANHANPGDENQAGDDQDQADENDQDEAGEDQDQADENDQDEAGDDNDQGDDNDDQGDVEDDQGENDGGD
jgi:hypothetical protein